MDNETYVSVMVRINRRKRDLELQPEDDEFEAQRYTADWMCGRLSLTVAERADLKLNTFRRC